MWDSTKGLNAYAGAYQYAIANAIDGEIIRYEDSLMVEEN
jgi:hypothetical protein